MNLNTNIKPILAIIVVVFGFAYFFYCAVTNVKPDPQILIAVVGAVGTSLGYYFGSSSGSAKKDEALTAQIGNTPVISGDNNTVSTKGE